MQVFPDKLIDFWCKPQFYLRWIGLQQKNFFRPHDLEQDKSIKDMLSSLEEELHSDHSTRGLTINVICNL